MNPIRQTSKLYNELCIVYEETKDIKKRFDKCFKIVDKSDYKEINYVIAMLKRNNSIAPENIEGFNSIIQIVKAVLLSFSGEPRMKHAFLLDILEEARERKRK